MLHLWKQLEFKRQVNYHAAVVEMYNLHTEIIHTWAFISHLRNKFYVYFLLIFSTEIKIHTLELFSQLFSHKCEIHLHKCEIHLHIWELDFTFSLVKKILKCEFTLEKFTHVKWKDFTDVCQLWMNSTVHVCALHLHWNLKSIEPWPTRFSFLILLIFLVWPAGWPCVITFRGDVRAIVLYSIV